MRTGYSWMKGSLVKYMHSELPELSKSISKYNVTEMQ